MGLDLTQEVIEQINLTTGSISKRSTQLRLEYQDINSTIDTYEQQWTEIVDNLGWWTKLFAGALGGNRLKVQKANELVDKIDELKIQLSRTQSEIEHTTKSFNSVIISQLRSQFDEFEVLCDDKAEHDRLYVASSNYLKLVQRSHKGVQDALIFMSWEKLIKHPEANEKLLEFRNETRKYQEKLDLYKSKVTSTLGQIKLEELIQFSTESVAMSSFNKIIQCVKELSLIHI